MARFEFRLAGLKVGEGVARLTLGWASWASIPVMATPWSHPRWRLDGYGRSLPPLSRLVTVEGELRAFMRTDDLSIDYRELRIRHPGEHSLRRETFDINRGIVWFWRDRWHHRRKDKEKITIRRNPLFHGSYDPGSLFMHLRCRGVEVGERLERAVHENGRNMRALVHVEGVETLETVFGRVPSLRAAIRVFSEEGKAKFRRPLLLWVSADGRYIPLQFEIDLRFADLKGRLVAYRQSHGAPLVGASGDLLAGR